ncbi:hypothetical protein ACSAZL_10630 [Methanosarcina sp. T3]|uniref:hypothetical protein n=1 Tax=Methanosarcina sp. T3 TaxID=3439062 RepID=UPI003F85F08E
MDKDVLFLFGQVEFIKYISDPYNVIGHIVSFLMLSTQESGLSRKIEEKKEKK